MMATLFRNIMLASVVLLLGCGTSKAPALKKHNSGLTGFPSAIQLLEIPAPGNCLEDENSSCPSPLEEEFLPAIGSGAQQATGVPSIIEAVGRAHAFDSMPEFSLQESSR